MCSRQCIYEYASGVPEDKETDEINSQSIHHVDFHIEEICEGSSENNVDLKKVIKNSEVDYYECEDDIKGLVTQN